MSCLLVRILKAHGEEGLHIDQLVCLVGREGALKLGEAGRKLYLGLEVRAKGHYKAG